MFLILEDARRHRIRSYMWYEKQGFVWFSGSEISTGKVAIAEGVTVRIMSVFVWATVLRRITRTGMMR